MRLKMIVAIDEENGIGKNNQLPWKYSEDLKYFSKKTTGESVFLNAVIMGRNTYESIGKALPDRVNYVLSKTLTEKETNKEQDNEEKEKKEEEKKVLYFFNNYKSLLEDLDSKVFNDLWVIGGEKIYKLFLDLDLVSEIYITKIKGNYNCDAFFPDLNGPIYKKKFKKTESVMGKTMENDKPVLEFDVYTRLS